MRVTASTQRVNTSPTTRLKAERLTVLDLTAREAVIEGDNDDYTVIFRSLTCTCPAGLRGLRCSHVQCAIRERARMNGFEHTAFSPNQQHMEAYAAMQRATGKRAVEHSDNGYFYVCSGKPVAPKVVSPVPTVAPAHDRLTRAIDHAAAQRAAESLY